MKVGLIGRSELLFNTAVLLHKKDFEIAFIITSKALPEYQVRERDFEKLSKQIGCDYFLAGKGNGSEFADRVKRSGAEIGISVNHPALIGKDLLNAFKFGVLNAHAGDLPRYRGNACPNWAILNGERHVTLVIHKMEPGRLDSGDVIAKRKYRLEADTYIGDVYAWLAGRTPGLFLSALRKIGRKSGLAHGKRGSEAQKGFRCYPRIPTDSEINWNLPALQIHRLIRASSEPFSGAYAFYRGEKIVIWRAELPDDGEKYIAMPGQISQIDKKAGTVTVITGDGKLRICSVSQGDDSDVRRKPSEIISSIRSRLESRFLAMGFVCSPGQRIIKRRT